MVSVDFSWTPLSSAVSYTLGGNTYPYNSLDGEAPTPEDIARYGSFITPTNTLITFVANVVTDLLIVRYKWDFGDGVVGYGPTATHTFRTYSPQQQVSLLVTDESAKRHYAAKQLNLRSSETIQVGFGLSS